MHLQKGKMYPRDQNRDIHFQGRCKVRLFNEKGAPVNAEFASRTFRSSKIKRITHFAGHALLVHVAQMIPKLKSRQQRSGATATGDAPSTSGAGGGKKKKK